MVNISPNGKFADVHVSSAYGWLGSDRLIIEIPSLLNQGHFHAGVIIIADRTIVVRYLFANQMCLLTPLHFKRERSNCRRMLLYRTFPIGLF